MRNKRSKDEILLRSAAFFGLVGYWLRSIAVEKRGYYFNSDREKWVVVREVEDWLVACADRQLRMHSMVGGNT